MLFLGTVNLMSRNCMNIFNSGDLFCSLCGKTFSFEVALAQHLGSNHKKLKEVTTIHSKVPIFNKKELMFDRYKVAALLCTMYTVHCTLLYQKKNLPSLSFKGLQC